MNVPGERDCPQCGKPVPKRAAECPHCKATVGIIAGPLEAVPPDVGQPEVLPPEQPAPLEGPITTRRRSVSTSVSVVTSSGIGSSHARAEVKLELPQELVDPDGRLSPAAYWRLMNAWAKAIEQEMAAAPGGPRPGLGPEMVQRVPLPFGPGCGAELPPALRDEITRRAQAVVGGMTRGVTPEGIFGPHAAPGGPLPPGRPGLSSWVPSSDRRRFTVSCGAVAASFFLAATAMLVWWLTNGL